MSASNNRLFNTNSGSGGNDQQYPCRCCGHAMRAEAQELMPKSAAKYGRSHLMMLTCDNEDCTLEGFTFSDVTYYDTDLKPYGVSE